MDEFQDEEAWQDLRLQLPLTDPWDKVAAILSALAYQLRVARQAVNFAAAIHQGGANIPSEADPQLDTGHMLRSLCAPIRAWVRTAPEGIRQNHVLDLLTQFEEAGRVLRPGAAQWILKYAMPTALVDNASDTEVTALDDALPLEDMDELLTRAQRQAARDRSASHSAAGSRDPPSRGRGGRNAEELELAPLTFLATPDVHMDLEVIRMLTDSTYELQLTINKNVSWAKWVPNEARAQSMAQWDPTTWRALPGGLYAFFCFLTKDRLRGPQRALGRPK